MMMMSIMILSWEQESRFVAGLIPSQYPTHSFLAQRRLPARHCFLGELAQPPHRQRLALVVRGSSNLTVALQGRAMLEALNSQRSMTMTMTRMWETKMQYCSSERSLA